MQLHRLVEWPSFKLDYFKQFIIYYVVTTTTLAHFVYTELFWVPRMDKFVDLDNPAILLSYNNNETVTGSMCMVLAVLVPFAVCLAHCLSAETVWRKTNPSSLIFSRDPSVHVGAHYFHCAMVLLWTSIGVTAMVTNVLKFWLSNFRPDFVDRCQPSAATLDAFRSGSPASVLAVCEQPNLHLLHEGLKSTPSGHSSMITCGTAFASTWVRSHVSGPRDWRSSCWWCPLLAVVVMVSRAVDHRHHWYDIVAGATLALAVVTCVSVHPLPLVRRGHVRELPT